MKIDSSFFLSLQGHQTQAEFFLFQTITKVKENCDVYISLEQMRQVYHYPDTNTTALYRFLIRWRRLTTVFDTDDINA